MVQRFDKEMMSAKRTHNHFRISELMLTNNNELLRHDFDHFLSQKSATATLDKVQVRVNFVSSIDSNIQVRVGVKGNQWDAKALRLFLSANRSGDADNVLQFSRLQLLSNSFDSEVSSGASSKSNDHATLDVVIDGLVSDFLLQFVLGLSHFESAGGSE